MKKRVALSWSGGKDSCMALDRLVKDGHEVACLLTTLPADIGRTFGHGERAERIGEQADALGLPVEWIACTFAGYTEDYVRTLKELKAKYQLEAVAFGDLFLEEHREWGTGAASAAGLEALYPLWMEPSGTRDALLTFVESGYRAVVIRVRDGALTEDWLGREVDRSFYEDIAMENVCPMGEGGEYHTFVYDGPLFRRPVPFRKGEVLQLETTKRLEHHG
ncbi:diphthine--ammonia ligase [Cohnella candidum]|uniref:Diphthine--ammonia ligase n=1 Tax=Cohnella candidum TaxID=2674991 RepID=A0A3G3K133_9BACL|nr:diphthine--ammonia ligase [Cohnella candidum]AYQ74275.1 diphthine--ammonia ligase [Cohnella candidum]